MKQRLQALLLALLLTASLTLAGCAGLFYPRASRESHCRSSSLREKLTPMTDLRNGRAGKKLMEIV